MAERRPLVDVAGVTTELPIGDTLPGSGGIAATLNFATIDVLLPEGLYKEVTFSDTNVTANSKIACSFSPDPNGENDNEELQDSQMLVSASGEAGQVRFFLTGNAPFFGAYKIQYQVF